MILEKDIHVSTYQGKTRLTLESYYDKGEVCFRFLVYPESRHEQMFELKTLNPSLVLNGLENTLFRFHNESSIRGLTQQIRNVFDDVSDKIDGGLFNAESVISLPSGLASNISISSYVEYGQVSFDVVIDIEDKTETFSNHTLDLYDDIYTEIVKIDRYRPDDFDEIIGEVYELIELTVS